MINTGNNMKNEPKVLLGVKVKPSILKAIRADAEKDDRSVSYIAAQILDKYYNDQFIAKCEKEAIKPPVKRFTPPNFKEAWEYFTEINPNVRASSEAKSFIDFYESKGWMVGKNKMKDWKAAVRNWIKRSKADGKTNGRQQPNQQGYKLSAVERVHAATAERRRARSNNGPSVGTNDGDLRPSVGESVLDSTQPGMDRSLEGDFTRVD